MQRISFDPLDSADIAQLTVAKKIVARHLPPTIANLYADPTLHSTQIEWSSDREGQPSHYRELAPVDQQKLLERFHQYQLSIKHLADELEKQGKTDDADAVRAILTHSDPDHLYSVGGLPVITRWRLNPVSAPADTNTILAPDSPAPPVAPAAPAMAQMPPPGRRIPWWLLFLLLLAFLAGLLYWFWWLPKHPFGDLTCIPRPADTTEKPEFVVIFDTSGSMNLNADISLEDEIWVTNFKPGPVWGKEKLKLEEKFRRLHAEPVRMTIATNTFAQVLQRVPTDTPINLITYATCPVGPIDNGAFDAASRPALINAIRGLEADGGTPLAASLRLAASKVDGVNRPAHVLVFVDGMDMCREDQCAVAQEIARAKPRLKFNVLDITGRGLSNCIAKSSGGRVYNVQNRRQTELMLRHAIGEITDEGYCK